MGSNVNLGSFGVTSGQNFDFHLKCINLSMLHSMPIRLIHIDQLETLCDFMGTNVNLGSFGVTGVKRSFALKML